MLTLEDLGIEQSDSKPCGIVTPEKAKEYLATFNHDNRDISQNLVSLYARLMTKKEWSNVTEISFDTNRRLIDGQHRLSAVIKSNLPQEFSFNFNCPPEAQRHIDTGKLRSAKDTLDMAGATNTKQMASTLMLYKDLRDGGLTNYAVTYGGQANKRTARSEKNDYVALMYEQHGELINDIVSFAQRTNRRNCGAVLNKSAVGAAALRAWDFGHLNIYKAFVEEVAEGIGLQRGTAQHTMAGSLQKLALRHPRERGKNQILALIIYFFNRRYKTIKKNKITFSEVEEIK